LGSLPETFSSAGEKVYQVGTLSYTKRGLIVLFAWMLWGDFCYTLMETVTPSILPLKLKALGTSNTVIALIMSTFPGILNATVCPWVSFWSDRYRSKLGRRIPFILYTLPFLTLFLIALGFSQQIGGWIHQIAFSQNQGISSTTLTVVMIGIFMVGFQFFNMFVGSVYWYFFNDVVPEQFIGRFLGLFRMVGGLAGALYNLFILKYAESHMTAIFLGAALLYFFGFLAMCFKVKEGQYPPPPEYVDGRQGILSGTKTFFIETFSLPFYWYMFGVYTFSGMANCVGIFNLIFIKEIGITLEQYGGIAAISGGLGILLTYPAGMFADKYHPVRVQLVMQMIVILLVTPTNLAFLFIKMSPQTTYWYYFITSMVGLPATVLWTAAQFPAMMRIFPKDRFGQFCAAQALVCSIVTILGGLMVGLIFDGLKLYYSGSDFAYRWIPAWSWLFQTLSFLCLFKVYQGWKQYGGLDHYVPPLSERKPISTAGISSS
jgi:MFS family permease